MRTITGTPTSEPITPIDVGRAGWLDAVRRRDAAFDGVFVYGVRTTGVFCKPSCASRPAREENISFHPDPRAAEAAGLRACKRCRPCDAADPHSLAVRRACERIRASETPVPLEALARAAGLSRFHFHRVFRAATGVTPRAFAAAEQARRATAALAEAESVTEAIYAAGFSGPGRFYEAAGRRLGMTPSQVRRGGEGATLRFAVGACSLGAILVAATERGVCAILLGDDPDTLVRDLQDRFPAAELIGGDAGFEQLVARVVGLVEAPRLGHDLPLDIRGTAFQERVWAALRAIPPGRTASYEEVAAAIGRPGAFRAVAGACAANPLAIAIPCHRVVRKDGGLSGYRWGVERKRELLGREAA